MGRTASSGTAKGAFNGLYSNSEIRGSIEEGKGSFFNA